MRSWLAMVTLNRTKPMRPANAMSSQTAYAWPDCDRSAARSSWATVVVPEFALIVLMHLPAFLQGRPGRLAGARSWLPPRAGSSLARPRHVEDSAHDRE